MKQVAIENTELSVSRIAFGTGSLHHLLSNMARVRLLEAAFDGGITHFDTSPYYGFGVCENSLGSFARGKRDRITITSKIGLYAPFFVPPISLAVSACKLAGSIAKRLNQPRIDWSIGAAEASLNRSLRRLDTSYLDFLLLHEPDPQSIKPDEFLSWLEKQHLAGKIRYWGVAGHATALSDWVDDDHPICQVIQTRDSLDEKQADFVLRAGRGLQFTYGYMKGRARESRDPSVYAKALRRNPTGSIIISTRKADRLRLAAEAFS